MVAHVISIENAKSDKLFYFVANVHVYRESDGRCLILKRSEGEKVFPGKWCVPGGKLEWGELKLEKADRWLGDVANFLNPIEELLAREVREEAGLKIQGQLDYLRSVLMVRPDGIPVILAIFAATYESGQVVFEQDSFTDFAWVNAKEVRKYDCIDTVPSEIEEVIRLKKA